MCLCVCVCVCVFELACVCLSVHVCIVCVCVRARSRVCMHLYIDVCVCHYACMLASNACMLACCVCIGQTSPLSSVRLRIQSSPCNADSLFLRWLTAVHVNNNICSTFIYLPKNIIYCTLTEDGDAKFIFYF